MEQQRDASAQQLSRVVNSGQLLTRFIDLLEELDKGMAALRKTLRAVHYLQQGDD